MFCVNCGSQMPEQSAFCPFCGSKAVKKDSLDGDKLKRISQIKNIQGNTNNINSPAPGKQKISEYIDVTEIATKRKTKIPFILVISALILITAITVAVGVKISRPSGNNLQEQLNLGNRYLSEMNYEQAIAAFEMYMIGLVL